MKKSSRLDTTYVRGAYLLIYLDIADQRRAYKVSQPAPIATVALF